MSQNSSVTKPAVQAQRKASTVLAIKLEIIKLTKTRNDLMALIRNRYNHRNPYVLQRLAMINNRISQLKAQLVDRQEIRTR